MVTVVEPCYPGMVYSVLEQAMVLTSQPQAILRKSWIGWSFWPELHQLPPKSSTSEQVHWERGFQVWSLVQHYSSFVQMLR